MGPAELFTKIGVLFLADILATAFAVGVREAREHTEALAVG